MPIPKRATARLILMQWNRQRLRDFICILSTAVKNAEHGEFGADMQIDSVLNGPVTIILDTDTWRKPAENR